jgi:eukaryotic-like serine/threonine-protein kinase
MGFFRFFKSKYFWIHTGLAIVLSIFILWFTLKALDIYTLHGSSIDVPDFEGKHISELDDYADDYDVRYEIIDSIYDFRLEKGSVVMQDPAAGTRVKDNRKVYLTVVALQPEQVEMPNLIDLTLRQATAMLETYGLAVGKLQYVPDIATNAVLKQKFKGKVIEEGSLIEKGSKIDLVLGQGEDNEKVEIPDLYGMKQGEAIKELKANSLNLGEEIFEDGADTTVSRVYKAVPGFRNVVSMGTSVKLYYRSERKHDFKNK